MTDDEVAGASALDLVGGPFAVIESDPAVFTTLMRKLGLRGLEMTEIYDIEPWATEHLHPRGLIFCFPCEDDSRNDDLYHPDPDAEDVWYAHQLSSDTCASQAILNVALNMDGVDMSDQLRQFSQDTAKMSPVMRGLAFTNCNWIRQAHNSLARPADLRGAVHAIATAAIGYSKKQKAAAAKEALGPPTKRRKTSQANRKNTTTNLCSAENQVESYHFIGYVPACGRVWELDGLRVGGPLEVGETPSPGAGSSTAARWMDIARPAIKQRMHNLLSDADENIRFNLLAIVDDKYEKASDELEMLKRERIQLERRLSEEYPEGWSDKVDTALYEAGSSIFETSERSHEPGPTFSRDFASRKLQKEIGILDMSRRSLPAEWEKVMQSAMTVKVAVQEEIENASAAHTEHLNRTFDYEPFIQTFITCLHHEGLLEPILSRSKPAEAPAEPTEKKPARKKKTG